MTNKIVFITLGLLLSYPMLFFSEWTEEETTPPIVEVKQFYLRAAEQVKVQVPENYPSHLQDKFYWKNDQGRFLQSEGRSVYFMAPASPGHYHLSCEQFRGRKKIATFTYQLIIFKQIVILKADDLVSDKLHVFPPYWNRYFDLIDSLQIAGSAGIIGISLEEENPAYFEKIKSLHQSGMVEFWNHGYSHTLRGKNEKGEEHHEYYNTSPEYQAFNLARTQTLGKEKLNITFRAFGAPGNFIDETTRKLIDSDKDICIWFYGDNRSSKSIAPKRPGYQIEFPVHHPDFNRFKANYQAEEAVLSIQFHPTRWDEARLHEFRKMLLFLQEQQVTFMTPSAFAQAFYPQLFKESIIL